ncbi:NADPH:quinone reductase [Mucilaginibacter lappiensis]|uniref:NADPH:quinone reductase-like Zn-dependent oxidoreductase n=1 Tax=Mucilaginibacter lappiensis TaxID=354630 RepID=A0ABR6PN98_9SPHI|nr:NADP-dependent oxidoreductase [Mucilaginibacter lappiensis]MBB6111243.1 NADPH:quinone reductase-like Zn-dependent oxidoreductase [Mucilaginibacter lappiensis]SIR73712.1 NADPH:quinone reductase [Mucilaginibacter lappiensis]
MKAIILSENGGTDKLVLKEVNKPVIAPNEVLIKTKALSINPVDGFVRKNEVYTKKKLMPQPGEEMILGWDVAGTVVETGTEVTDFETGDEVFGMVKFPGHAKGYAEYVAAPADHLALKPSNISYREAAAATLAALTAWQGLVTYAKIQPGDKVLIHAAAGGVGHYAIQIAKHFGAYVIGTGSAASKDFILSQGADEFIDYNREKFEDRVKDANIVLDSIYGDHILRSINAVKHGGRLVSLLAFFESEIAEKAKAKELLTYRIAVESNGDDMKEIAKLLANGELKSYVSDVYSFEDIPKAQDKVDGGKTRGKIVIEL